MTVPHAISMRLGAVNQGQRRPFPPGASSIRRPDLGPGAAFQTGGSRVIVITDPATAIIVAHTAESPDRCEGARTSYPQPGPMELTVVVAECDRRGSRRPGGRTR